MAELPSGTVTLLFSDIEGSTRLLTRLRGRYPEVLAEHRRLLRATFDEHDGREVHTEGDAFFVAFARASDAIAASRPAPAELESTSICVSASWWITDGTSSASSGISARSAEDHGLVRWRPRASRPRLLDHVGQPSTGVSDEHEGAAAGVRERQLVVDASACCRAARPHLPSVVADRSSPSASPPRLGGHVQDRAGPVTGIRVARQLPASVRWQAAFLAAFSAGAPAATCGTE
jgi:hypothetical protein